MNLDSRIMVESLQICGIQEEIDIKAITALSSTALDDNTKNDINESEDKKELANQYQCLDLVH